MLLTVQDDGKGFDGKANGHGMGLRIMRYRAQCIGGSCEVHAGPSQGTIVHCRVPLRRSLPFLPSHEYKNTDRKNIERGRSRGSSGAPRGPEAANRRPTGPFLHCGADDTSDAKRLAEQCKADLMLLDLRLKTGDALDLIKSLRVEHPELKVLVLSQYDELLFAERALRAGASGYIMKETLPMRCCEQCAKFSAGECISANESPQRSCNEPCAKNRTVRVSASNACPIVKCKVLQLLGAAYSPGDCRAISPEPQDRRDALRKNQAQAKSP